MSDLLTAFGSLFTFLIGALGDIADFFTTNTIGMLILGIAVFTIIVNIIMAIVNKVR